MDSTTTKLSGEMLAATTALADLLERTDAIRAYHEARARLDADEDARTLLERYSTAQAQVRGQQAKGAVVQTDIEALRALQREVQADAVIMMFAKAQQEAIDFLPQVNSQISNLLGVDFAALARPSGGGC